MRILKGVLLLSGLSVVSFICGDILLGRITTEQAAQMQLNNAILNGSLNDVKGAIAGGADVNLLDSDGKSPVWFALMLGHFGIVYELLQAGAKADVVYKGNTFARAFVDKAIKNPGSDAIKGLSLLVANGVDFTSGNLDYSVLKSGIVYVTLNQILDSNFTGIRVQAPEFMQVKADILELMQQLALRGYPIAEQLWSYDPTTSSTIYTVKDFIDFCLKNGVNINQNLLANKKNRYPIPALFKAISRSYANETTAMENLLAAGADINLLADPKGNGEMQTPLAYAISQGKTDAIQVLLAHGARQ